MKKSLKAKLIIMFVIFISVPLIASGVFSYISASTAMEKSTEGNLVEITNKTGQIVQSTVSSVEKYIQLMTMNKDIPTALKTNSTEDKKNAFDYIAAVQSAYSKEIEQIVIVDLSSKGIISNANMNENIDLSDRDYIKTALSGIAGKSGVIESKTTGKRVIAIAYPLTYENKVVGAILASIKLETITEHLDKVKIGKGGYAFMLNKDGLMLHHPVGDKILKEKVFETTSPSLKALTEIMKTGKSGSGEYNYEGVEKYMAFVPVGDWIVAVTANYNEYMDAAFKIRTNTLVLTIISLIVAIGAAYGMTTRNIIKPIKQLEDLMIQAGQGDLTVLSNIKTRDEIQTLGEKFNDMIQSQGDIINNVRKSAEELAASSEEMASSTEIIGAASEEITNSIQGVAADAEEQNNAVVEASKVLVELSSLVQIAQNKSSTAKGNSDTCLQVAQGGRTYLKQTVQAMDGISEVSTETSETLKALEQLSNKVGVIVTTINGIAEQTNLLALNAAIEAARAGEQGRGFAVVADEVRKLSEESTKGANEITTLVGEMVHQISLAVKSMEYGMNAVNEGVAVVSQTDEAFLSIIGSVEQIVKDIKQIDEITKSEVASSEQIIKLIDSVATRTEGTAASSEQVSASTEEQVATIQNLSSAAEEVSAMANELNILVERFRIRGE